MPSMTFRHLAVCIFVLTSSVAAVPLSPNIVNTVDLNEDGYQQVASLQSDANMTHFIHRVLESMGLVSANDGDLNGLASYYSGTEATQSYDRLRDELSNATWTRKINETDRAGLEESVDNDLAVQQAKSKIARRRTRKAVKAKASPVPGSAMAQAAPSPGEVTAKAATQLTSKTLKPKAHAKIDNSVLSQATAGKAAAGKASAGSRSAEKTRLAKSTASHSAKATAKVAPKESALSLLQVPGNGASLPKVESVLAKASDTFKDFASDASRMQAQVAERQSQSRAALAALKKGYEAQLATMKADLAQVVQGNDNLQTKIGEANATNERLVADSALLKKSIRLLRRTAGQLKGEVERAQGFVDDSINVTDVRDAIELRAIAVTTPEPNFDFFLKEARGQLGLNMTSPVPSVDSHPEVEFEEALALLQVGNSVKSEHELETQDPKKMTSLLAETLAKLSKAEQHGRHTLLTKFETSRNMWKERTQEARSEERRLSDLLETVSQRTQDLKAANNSLADTNTALRNSMVHFEAFLKGLRDVSLQAAQV